MMPWRFSSENKAQSKEQATMIKRMTVLVSCLLVAGFIAGNIAEGKKVTFAGYLLDQMCGADVKDTAKAAEHTKECALMDHCVAAGYGIFAEGKFIKFDALGNKKAKAFLENSKKEKGILVVVEGNLNGDVLTVSAIKEKVVR
jgi:hypothetical protein